MVKFKKDNIEAVEKIVSICIELGNLEQGIQFVEHWLQESSHSKKGYLLLVNLYVLSNKIDTALERFELFCRLKGVKDNSTQLTFLFLRGCLFRKNNLLCDAAELFNICIYNNIFFLPAYLALADTLVELSQTKEAITLLCHVVCLFPEAVVAYFKLSELKFYDDSKHKHIEYLELILSSRKLSKRIEQKIACFTIAKVFEAEKKFDLAFRYYATANRLDLKKWSVKLSKILNDNRIKFFNSKFFSDFIQKESFYHCSMVYIVGMPRSGTSLVEQMLATSSFVLAQGETHDIPDLITRLPGELGSKKLYPFCLTDINSETLDKIRINFFKKYMIECKSIFTDKMPGNFQELGLIWLLFPNAKIIHCRRNPIDVCLSCYCQNFTHLSFSNNLKNIALFYLEYERIMTHWKSTLPIEILEVKYEDLVYHPETHSRRIFDFCRLSWDSSCLEFHRSHRTVRTASAYQVKRPVYTQSVGKWINYQNYLFDMIHILEDCLKNESLY